jgi:DNA-binding transcriptional ArsR family regulator
LTGSANHLIVRNMSNYKNIAGQSLEELAEIFKALSNPNRLKIFLRLVTCCTPGTVGIRDSRETHEYVGRLGEELDIVKSTVSHHMKELRRVGLIRTERQGQKIACWVDPDVLSKLKVFFSF